MKKQLLCTSAIALGVAAAPAAAQEWTVDVGGYYNFYTGFSGFGGNAEQGQVGTGAPGNPITQRSGPLNGADFEGLQINKDSEIYISPSIDLDNGMTFGVDFQLETADGADMDEVYMYAESDTFGRLEAGSHNSAGYLMSVAAPNPGGLPINSGSVSAFVPFAASGVKSAVPTIANTVAAGNNITPPTNAGLSANSVDIANSFVGAGASSFTEVGAGVYGTTGDEAKITYFSPDFNGFTFGLSYTPGNQSGSDGSTGLVNQNTAMLTDAIDIGLNYSMSFKTMDVTLSARYGTANGPGSTPRGFSVTYVDQAPGSNLGYGLTTITNAQATADDPEVFAVGGQLGFGQFTVGGSYERNDSGLSINGTQGGNNVTIDDIGSQEGFSLGATYDVAGPWNVGLEYKYGEADHGSSLGEDELSIVKLAGSRNLGPGVTWGVSLVYSEIDAADPTDGSLLATAPGGGTTTGGVDGTDLDATTLTTSLKFAF